MDYEFSGVRRADLSREKSCYRSALVVVAAFNEAGVIGRVVQDLLGRFPNVVVIDDCSSDGTGALAEAAGAKVLTHAINLGQGAALQTGLAYGLSQSHIDYFITFDADGQHRVEDAAKILDRLVITGADIVFGTRFGNGGSLHVPRMRRFVLALARIHVNSSSGLGLSDAHNGLRGFRRKVAEAFDLQHAGMAHASEMANIVGAAGFAVEEQPVEVLYTEYSRAKGQTVLNGINILFDLFWRR